MGDPIDLIVDRALTALAGQSMAVKTSAQEAAEKLLLSWLSPKQKHQFLVDNEVEVRGSEGNTYIVPRTGFIIRVDDGYQFCFWPANALSIPVQDIMLARIIMLQCAEKEALDSSFSSTYYLGGVGMGYWQDLE